MVLHPLPTAEEPPQAALCLFSPCLERCKAFPGHVDLAAGVDVSGDRYSPQDLLPAVGLKDSEEADLDELLGLTIFHVPKYPQLPRLGGRNPVLPLDAVLLPRKPEGVVLNISQALLKWSCLHGPFLLFGARGSWVGGCHSSIPADNLTSHSRPSMLNAAPHALAGVRRSKRVKPRLLRLNATGRGSIQAGKQHRAGSILQP